MLFPDKQNVCGSFHSIVCIIDDMVFEHLTCLYYIHGQVSAGGVRGASGSILANFKNKYILMDYRRGLMRIFHVHVEYMLRKNSISVILLL